MNREEIQKEIEKFREIESKLTLEEKKEFIEKMTEIIKEAREKIQNLSVG